MFNKRKLALRTAQRWTAEWGKQMYFRIMEWRVVLGQSVKPTSTFCVLLFIHSSAQVIQLTPGPDCLHSDCTSWTFETTLFACHTVSWEMCSMVTLLTWERKLNMCLSVSTHLSLRGALAMPEGAFGHMSAFTWRAHFGQTRLMFKRQVWSHFSLGPSY